MIRVFANGPWDQGSIPGWIIPKTQKMFLDVALLNTHHYKVRIKGKVEQSKESGAIQGKETSGKPRLSSPTFILLIYIYIYISRDEVYMHHFPIISYLSDTGIPTGQYKEYRIHAFFDNTCKKGMNKFSYIYTDPLALWVECLPMVLETSIQSHVESYATWWLLG